LAASNAAARRRLRGGRETKTRASAATQAEEKRTDLRPRHPKAMGEDFAALGADMYTCAGHLRRYAELIGRVASELQGGCMQPPSRAAPGFSPHRTPRAGPGVAARC